jgi:hypothetical protein
MSRTWREFKQEAVSLLHSSSRPPMQGSGELGSNFHATQLAAINMVRRRSCRPRRQALGPSLRQLHQHHRQRIRSPKLRACVVGLKREATEHQFTDAKPRVAPHLACLTIDAVFQVATEPTARTALSTDAESTSIQDRTGKPGSVTVGSGFGAGQERQATISAVRPKAVASCCTSASFAI